MKKILAAAVLALSLAGCGVGTDEPTTTDQTGTTEQALTCVTLKCSPVGVPCCDSLKTCKPQQGGAGYYCH